MASESLLTNARGVRSNGTPQSHQNRCSTVQTSSPILSPERGKEDWARRLWIRYILFNVGATAPFCPVKQGKARYVCKSDRTGYTGYGVCRVTVILQVDGGGGVDGRE